MTRRVLRTELLRGTAPVAAAALAVCGAVLLFGRLAEWGGRWGALAGNVRTNLIVLVPLAVAAGAWQAGRERRRRTGELLASVPRPLWQPRAVAWAAVTVATVGGALASFAVGGLLVAPVASYAGGDWPLLLLVAVPALAAAVAAGALAGWTVPGRFVAPLAGFAAYAGLGVLTYLDLRYARLSPVVFGADGLRGLPLATHLGQAALFTAVAATALVLALARRRWLAAAPAAAAVLAAATLAYGPAAGDPEDGYLLADPAASELVCTAEEPVVCLTRVHAFLLDDVAPHARALLARFEGVPGAPRGVVEALPDQGLWRVYMGDASGQRAVTVTGAEAAPAPHLPVWLGTRVDVRGGLRDPDELLVDMAGGLFPFWCQTGDDFAHMEWWDAAWLAHEWALHGLVEQPPLPPGEGSLAEALLALPPAGQRAWMGRYLAAAAGCDAAERDALLAEL